MLEGWNEFYTEEEIEKIHKIELISFDVFSDVCKKLGIKFFMYGGSLLGTVKYQGFIPWDDDLDIAFLREDYEKFILEAPSLLPENYEIQHPKVNKKTPYHYIKFRRRDTKLVEYKNHKVKINHGVYFDIYPIDNIPDNYEDYLSQKLEYDKWISIFQVRQNFRIDRKISSAKDLAITSLRLFQSLIAHLFSLSFLIGKIDDISTKYNGEQTNLQGCLSFPKPNNYFNGVDFVSATFEGREVFIPSGYKVNLINRYGDINRLPPEEKRVGHKPYILSLESEETECL